MGAFTWKGCNFVQILGDSKRHDLGSTAQLTVAVVSFSFHFSIVGALIETFTHLRLKNAKYSIKPLVISTFIIFVGFTLIPHLLLFASDRT